MIDPIDKYRNAGNPFQETGCEHSSRCWIGPVGFDPVTEQEASTLIVSAISAGRGGRCVTPNIDILRQASLDSATARLVNTADLVLADGMPIIWASRLMQCELPERVAGSSLTPGLVELAGHNGIPIILLGGKAGAARRVADELMTTHRGLEVRSHYPPFGFETDQSQLELIEQVVVDLTPAICLIGLGFPKQDLLALRLRSCAPRSWFLGVGITIDLLAGEQSRAPRVLQERGFEWAYRLSREPRRLGRRYLAHDIPYASSLLGQALLRRTFAKQRNGSCQTGRSGPRG